MEGDVRCVGGDALLLREQVQGVPARQEPRHGRGVPLLRLAPPVVHGPGERGREAAEIGFQEPRCSVVVAKLDLRTRPSIFMDQKFGRKEAVVAAAYAPAALGMTIMSEKKYMKLIRREHPGLACGACLLTFSFGFVWFGLVWFGSYS